MVIFSLCSQPFCIDHNQQFPIKIYIKIMFPHPILSKITLNRLFLHKCNI